ncbi:MAG: flippase [Acidimicrobiales bacterium]|nr:flippase [Acidimicrobiales bacterium]
MRRLGRQSALSFVGSVVTAASALVVLKLITEYLSAESVGAVNVAVAFFNILMQVAIFGVGAGMVRHISQLRVEGRVAVVPQLLRTGLVPVFLVGFGLSLLMVLAAPQLADLLSKQSSSASMDGLTDALRGAGPFLPVAALAIALMATTRGFGVIRPTALYNGIGRPLAQLAAVAIALAFTRNTALIAAAWMAAYVVPAVMGAIVSRRLYRRELDRTGGRSKDRWTDPVEGREFWRFTAPQGGVEILRAVVRWQDTILIAILLGLREAAIYSVVTRLVKLAAMVNQAIVEVTGPQMAEAFASRDLVRGRQIYQTATSWLVLLAFPIYLTTAFFAEPLTVAVFGAEYGEGAAALTILSLGRLVSTAVGPVESVLVMSGQTSHNLAMHTSALVVNIVLNLVLVPQWGLEGAAVAWVASIMVTNLGPYVQVRRSTGLQPFGSATIEAILITSVAFGAVAAVAHLATDPSFVIAIMATVVAGLLTAGWAIGRREFFGLDQLLNRIVPSRSS